MAENPDIALAASEGRQMTMDADLVECPTCGGAGTASRLNAATLDATPALDVDNDDFRDDHERAMRDHILAREHACDDLCSDDIVTRLAARFARGDAEHV